MKEIRFKPGEMVYYRGLFSKPRDTPILGIITREPTSLAGIYKVFVFEIGKEIDINETCLQKV